MKRLLAPLLLLLTVLPARPAAPTFGQVMWTNDTAKVLLSPERSTNRIQLGTNLVTLGGVSSAFPSFWREGTTINARLADNSGFAPFTAGPLNSRTLGMTLDTEDSATIFAYSFLFRKKGNGGGTNNTLDAETELGNLQWQGWDGAAYNTAVGWLPKTEQPWVAGLSLGARMELRLTSSNEISFHNAFAFTGVTATNAFLEFNPQIGGAAVPGLQRFGRQVRIRSGDNSGFADLAVSNIATIRGLNYVWPSAHVASSVLTNDGVGNLGFLAVSALAPVSFSDLVWTNNGLDIRPVSTALRALRQGLVTGNQWDTTNVGAGSVAFGSNNLAGGYMSGVLSGGRNWIATNNPFSVIAGGETNSMGPASGGHNFIGGGSSNLITTLSSNSVIVGGTAHVIAGSVSGGSIGGGHSNQVLNVNGTVAGGTGNQAGGNSATAGGGQGNIAGNTSGSDFVTIGGGLKNQVNPDWGTIAGGATNFIQNNATYGFIGGGRGNDINSIETVVGGGVGNIININAAAGQILGGLSNNLINPTALGVVIGNFGTNATDKSILLSPAGTHSLNRMHIAGDGTTNTGNMIVKAGVSAGWAKVGGTLYSTNLPVVNAGVAETNLASYTIPAHVLSNLNSTIVIEASGSMQKSVVGTNQIRLLYGSEVLMDTGLQTASNGWYRIRATIAASSLTAGFTNQFTTADHFWWGTGVTGMPFRDTNFNTWATQTNGISTLLRLATTSRRNGGITNESFLVRWWPNAP